MSKVSAVYKPSHDHNFGQDPHSHAHGFLVQKELHAASNPSRSPERNAARNTVNNTAYNIARTTVSNIAGNPIGTQDSLRAPVILMVSGGADSTALLVLAATSALDIQDGNGRAHIARERLHVLHVNHQLRGLDSQEDEEFVRELADGYGIPCTVKTANISAYAAKTDGNIEAAGREFRYKSAAELAFELAKKARVSRGSVRILTAHTANDRAETFFMNAIRGSGSAGLSSIPRRRNRIVRPLLDYTHAELCEFLRMKGIVWREDATNADTRYLRAYVRHEILPQLKKRNANLLKNMSSTCDIIADEDAFMAGLAARAYKNLIRRRAEGMLALDAARLAASDVALARRIMRMAILDLHPAARIEAKHIAAALTLVAQGKGSARISSGLDVRVEYGLLFMRMPKVAPSCQGGAAKVGWLSVLPIGGLRQPDKTKSDKVHNSYNKSDPHNIFETATGQYLRARILRVPHGISAETLAKTHSLEWQLRSVLLDAASCGIDPVLGGRLWVDTLAEGDVMCPLGMHGQSKKIKDLMNEAKIPSADRWQIPLVRTSDVGSVIWVAGIRADDRMRCTPKTSELLELSIIDKEELCF